MNLHWISRYSPHFLLKSCFQVQSYWVLRAFLPHYCNIRQYFLIEWVRKDIFLKYKWAYKFDILYTVLIFSRKKMKSCNLYNTPQIFWVCIQNFWKFAFLLKLFSQYYHFCITGLFRPIHSLLYSSYITSSLFFTFETLYFQ